MSIGIGQIIIIILIVVLLFGKLPNLFKDLAQGIKNFKNTMDDPKKESTDKTPDEGQK